MRHIINRYCPTQAQVDHGTVAIVLVINRLMFPLPMYQIADWVGKTILAAILRVPAEKFNDDRLERTLDALYPHLENIWTEIATVALRKANVDLSVIFYDLTAFVVHGRYEESELIDFGFAHNTPRNKRKFKLALNTVSDGNLPWLYHLWSGRMADQATVQNNMDNLLRWLDHNKLPHHKTLIVGDRAMLSAKIAVTYDQANLQYLSGLRAIQTEHKALLKVWSDTQIESFPIVSGSTPQYWGRGCKVNFTYKGDTVTHKGLVVVSGPLRDQLRQTRNERLQALDAALTKIRQEIGQPRMRTIKVVQRRVNSRLKNSKVGKLMHTTVYETTDGTVNLVWQINRTKLAQVERLDGRYLLVTNNRNLSHKEIFQLYRDKDGGEKRFFISKNDLAVTPIYLHKDKRIASMMMLNMIALLAYSLLERQMREQGLNLTTRKLLERLRNLTVIETHYLDDSVTRHLTPLTPEIQTILPLVAEALETLMEDVVSTQTPFILPNSHPSLRLPSLC
ncbi:MAG: IS1634 family transposase [Candidatus Thermoplasmatota archaeon]|nr:IS1634 family transposase [Candidatus Thermoplasmatota archaeon]